MQTIIRFSKICQNFAEIENFAKAFKISPGSSKFLNFSHLGENFASLATMKNIQNFNFQIT